MKVYNCTTCDTELKPWEAHLRGNVIDDEPIAWCRIHAVAEGIVDLPLPTVEAAPVVPVQRQQGSLLRRLVGQR